MVVFLLPSLFAPKFVHLTVGVILKMAQTIKGSSARGQKYLSDIVKKPQTMVIPAREVVQIVAKVLYVVMCYISYCSFSFLHVWCPHF